VPRPRLVLPQHLHLHLRLRLRLRLHPKMRELYLTSHWVRGKSLHSHHFTSTDD